MLFSLPNVYMTKGIATPKFYNTEIIMTNINDRAISDLIARIHTLVTNEILIWWDAEKEGPDIEGGLARNGVDWDPPDFWDLPD
jgi:hypothetical protein